MAESRSVRKPISLDMNKDAFKEYQTVLDLLIQQAEALKTKDLNVLDRIKSELPNTQEKIERFPENFQKLESGEREKLKTLLEKLTKQVKINQDLWRSDLKAVGDDRAKLRSARRFYQELSKFGQRKNPRYSQNV